MKKYLITPKEKEFEPFIVYTDVLQELKDALIDGCKVKEIKE
jgi:hypothetical protein